MDKVSIISKSLLLYTSYLLLLTTTFTLSAPGDSNPPSEGAIRLERLNGFSAKEAGNVMIYHEGRWGAVCDDGWVLHNANVVCRLLGYKGGAIGHAKNSYFGKPNEG